jgi:hypothetical protein
MKPVRRLISSFRSEIQQMTAQQLKKSIEGSEGRVVLTQFFSKHKLCDGTTNAELQQAFGSDMIMLNGYNMDPSIKMEGLAAETYDADAGWIPTAGRLPDLKKYVDIPIGIYLECGDPHVYENLAVTSYGINMLNAGRIANRENLLRAKEEGAAFVVLGGNPGSGTTYENIIEATKLAKEVLGEDVLIFSGKWEDGVLQKVLGDPQMGQEKSKAIIKSLIDAGADVITLPMPGARYGISTEEIRDLVTFVHTYRPGTLALSFLDGSVEGADIETIRTCTVMSKITGADIHAIGDAGLHGTPLPENIYAMAIAVKGRRLTWRRIGGSRR